MHTPTAQHLAVSHGIFHVSLLVFYSKGSSHPSGFVFEQLREKELRENQLTLAV